MSFGRRVLQLKKYRFLFEELVKRDFKKKYKRSILGMGWSMLSPLLMLLVMKIVFEQFFGRNTSHYTTYLFCGLVVYNWFAESTGAGMRSLMGNSGIFSKVNVPKYLFLFSVNVQTLLNFTLTLTVFFTFCLIDHIEFTWKFVFLLYPITTLLVFNIGVGLILSAFFVFFRDIDYLWTVALQLIMYGSAIFYPVDRLGPKLQAAFMFNPVYRHIAYFREIVLQSSVPSIECHLVLAGVSLAVLMAGGWMYRHYNTKFLYYV